MSRPVSRLGRCFLEVLGIVALDELRTEEWDVGKGFRNSGRGYTGALCCRPCRCRLQRFLKPEAHHWSQIRRLEAWYGSLALSTVFALRVLRVSVRSLLATEPMLQRRQPHPPAPPGRFYSWPSCWQPWGLWKRQELHVDCALPGTENALDLHEKGVECSTGRGWKCSRGCRPPGRKETKFFIGENSQNLSNQTIRRDQWAGVRASTVSSRYHVSVVVVGVTTVEVSASNNIFLLKERSIRIEWINTTQYQWYCKLLICFSASWSDLWEPCRSRCATRQCYNTKKMTDLLACKVLCHGSKHCRAFVGIVPIWVFKTWDDKGWVDVICRMQMVKGCDWFTFQWRGEACTIDRYLRAFSMG